MSSAKAGPVVSLALLLGAGGCGESPPAMKLVPTPEVVRTVYGLGDGSCWKYRFSQGGTNLFATVTLSGPNETAIAGHSVWVRKYQLESGGLPTEDYLEVGEEAEVRLLRHVEGQQDARVTRRYEDDPTPPLFARFRYDASAGATLNEGDRFETMPTPKDLPIERHVWTVLSENDTASTPGGDQTAYKLQYARGANETAVYHLVPNFGFAKITDFAGVTHQVCAARVCDASGACTGAASCMSSDLVCP